MPQPKKGLEIWSLMIRALVLLLVLLHPHQVWGWGNTWMGINLERTVNSTRWKSGAAHYNVALWIDNAGYDSDIYFGATLAPVPDYTFWANVPIRIFVPVKRKVVFDISDIPQYAFFLKTKDLRGWNNAFAFQVHFCLDKFYVHLRQGLSTIQDRLGMEAGLIVRHSENNQTGLILWQSSKSTSFAVQYRQTVFDYENVVVGETDIQAALNRHETYVNARAYLQQVSRLRFYLDGEYGVYDFQESTSFSKNSQSYGAFGGVEFIPPPSAERLTNRGVQGRVNIGYKIFDLRDPNLADFKGLVGNTNVSVGIIPRTALRGYFTRDVQFSAFSEFAYYLSTVVGVGISRSLTRRAHFMYDYFFGRITYPEEAISVPYTVSDYRTHNFRLILTATRDLEINLLASLQTRESNPFFPGGKRNFFGFSLIYGYMIHDNPMLANPIAQY